MKDKNGKMIISRKQFEKLYILLNIPFLISSFLFFGSLLFLFIGVIISVVHGYNMPVISSAIIFLLSCISSVVLANINTSNLLNKKYAIEEENIYAYLQQLGYEGEPLKAAGKFLLECDNQHVY